LNKFLFLIILTLTSSFAQKQDHSGKIEYLVKSLGIDDGDSLVYVKLDSLRYDPNLTIKLLIDELHPVKGIPKILSVDYDKYKMEIHVVWCIRALRYITGLDFISTTKYKFGNTESERTRSQFLHSEFNKVSFFGVWMSRNTIYFAPLDAQKAIILKWKNWYDKNKGHIKLIEARDFNEWFF
jgi:hypothetical protein